MKSSHSDTIGMFLELSRRLTRAMSCRVQGKGKVNLIRLHALLFISENESMTMTDFARLMSISPSTATTFVDRMVKERLVKRTQDSDNRRRVLLVLTKQGASAIAKSMKIKKTILNETFRILPTSERQHLNRILSRLLYPA